MNRRYAALMIAGILTLVASPRSAVARVWSDGYGRLLVRANFIAVEGSNVRLQKDNGEIISIPLAALQPLDQYVAKELERLPRSTVHVEATGVGITSEEALNDAFRRAVETAVGALIDSETEVRGDRLAKDRVLVFSDGFITDYKPLEERVQQGLVSRRILATVQRRDLVSQTKRAGSEVAAGSIYSEAFTKLRRRQVGLLLVQRALDSFGPQLLDAELTSAAHPELIPGDDEHVKVPYEATIRVNRERYEKLGKLLIHVLEPLSAYSGSVRAGSVVLPDETNVRHEQVQRDSYDRYLQKSFFAAGLKEGVTARFTEIALLDPVIAGELPAPNHKMEGYAPAVPSTLLVINTPWESGAKSHWRWFQIDSQPTIPGVRLRLAVIFWDGRKRPVYRDVTSIRPTMPGISVESAGQNLLAAVLGPFFIHHVGKGYQFTSIPYAKSLTVRGKVQFSMADLAAVESVGVTVNGERLPNKSAGHGTGPNEGTVEIKANEEIDHSAPSARSHIEVKFKNRVFAVTFETKNGKKTLHIHAPSARAAREKVEQSRPHARILSITEE